MTDELPLRGEIFEELKCCAVSNIPRKISNIVELMKLAALVEDFPPEPDRIHLSNGTLFMDGTFVEGKPKIVRNRFPVAYNPNAPQPVLWLQFLDGLLYPEDIPTLQEYIGYCLIPSNKGQRMMVIKGSGGEGKSQIGAVLGTLFGSNMKDGSICLLYTSHQHPHIQRIQHNVGDLFQRIVDVRLCALAGGDIPLAIFRCFQLVMIIPHPMGTGLFK